MARFHVISGRLAEDPNVTLRRMSFKLGPPLEADATRVVDEADWHLMEFDVDKGEAAFVRISDGTDVHAAAFLHQELLQRATELMIVPFADVIALAQKLPEPGRIVHLLSIGRCGSTLAHHLFHNAVDVLSLSEPDTYFTLVMAHTKMRDEQSIGLLQASSRFHFLAASRKGKHTLVVKHHSQSILMAERLRAADPQAHFVFMYRDAESWAKSAFHMVQGFDFPPVQTRAQRELLWHIFSGGQNADMVRDVIDLDDEDAQCDRWLAVVWALYIGEYLRLWQANFRMLTVVYADLVSKRLASVQRLFGYCGLDADHLERVLCAFDTDSQAGTHLAKDKTTVAFSEVNMRNFRETLAKFPSISSPRIALPTL